MEKSEGSENESGPGVEEESSRKTRDSDDSWGPNSENEIREWKLKKERCEEVLEYFREVDEILNLIKPFPRETGSERGQDDGQSRTLMIRQNSTGNDSSRCDLNHLENVIKLVERLKELQENNYRFGERIRCTRDLKRLRDHKRRLKYGELELRNGDPDQRAICSSANQVTLVPALPYTRSKSIPEKVSQRAICQKKRKSLCSLTYDSTESKSKVSKWTKVKEAFHWERTSHSATPKTFCKNDLPRERTTFGVRENDFEVGSYYCNRSPEQGRTLMDLDGLPLPPPPPSPLPRLSDSSLLSVPPIRDLPSSSSSDKIDEFFFPDDPKSCGIPDEVDNDDVENRRRVSPGEESTPARLNKSSKTTWGKVKDIIQTRKESLKKTPKKRNDEEYKKRRKLSFPSQLSDRFEDFPSPEEKPKLLVVENIASEEYPEVKQEEKPFRKSMPSLRITLPSSEESRDLSSEREESGKEKVLGQLTCQARYCEERPKFTKNKSGQNQRMSRWIKVKNVFLNPPSPSHSPSSAGTTSSPTDTRFTFFSDMESDDFSSGEWMEENAIARDESKRTERKFRSREMKIVREDIRKSYGELRKKLSQEFERKIREWESVKIDSTSSKSEAMPGKAKSDEGKDKIVQFRKTRECMTVPLPSIDDLSPEFRKKLNDWRKMKTCQSSSSVPSSIATTKEDVKIKIGEWQPWRSRCAARNHGKCEQISGDESEKNTAGGGGGEKGMNVVILRPPSTRRKVEEENPGKDSKRKESLVKITHGRFPSGSDCSTSLGTMEKNGRSNKRSQKLKDFQWVEKELQKIEREKMKLEQEKEKYLEKEARLEQMKNSIGTSFPGQEILVRTPTGLIKFEGISQKFTKKLYEWEKARGIAPEASTFALLKENVIASPKTNYQYDMNIKRSKLRGSVPELSSSTLSRGTTHHQSSLSLNDVDDLKTLEKSNVDDEDNDDDDDDDEDDDKEDDEDDDDDDTDRERLKVGVATDEPEALIVDVEDVIEETAVMVEPPPYRREVPVYTYASDDLNQLENSKERNLKERFENIEGKQIERKKSLDDCKVVCDSRPLSNPNLVQPDSSPAEPIFEIDYSNRGGDEKKTGIRSTEMEQTEGFFSLGNHRNLVEKIQPEVPDIPSVSVTLPLRKLRLKSETRVNEMVKSDRSTSATHQETIEVAKSKNVEKCQVMESKSEKKGSERVLRETKSDDWKDGLEKREICQGDDDSRKVRSLGRNHPRPPISLRSISSEPGDGVGSDSSTSVNVFVPTRRKIISPVRTCREGVSPAVFSYVIDDVKSERTNVKTGILTEKTTRKPETEFSHLRKSESLSSVGEKRDIGIPPLPVSPKSSKKLISKESTAPSIRMLVAKYNRKMLEKNGEDGESKIGGSSKVWRSPVSVRRTRKWMDEKEEKNEISVRKSASYGNAESSSVSTTDVFKSNSTGVIKMSARKFDGPESTISTESIQNASPAALRALKLKKAKENFLSGKPSLLHEQELCNGSKSEATKESDGNDIKSTSTEVVTEVAVANPEDSSSPGDEGKLQGETTLQKSSSKFDISTTIKSKFRKMKLMRREKETKLNSVSALCRQSLLIDLPSRSEAKHAMGSSSKSCPSSPIMDRSKMNIKKWQRPVQKSAGNHADS